MAQRILDPTQIETLTQRSIPRVRLPDRSRVFARRAARLRELAETSPIGDYLHVLARVADAQQLALANFAPAFPDAAAIARAREHGMPPLHAPGWQRDRRWCELVRALAGAAAAAPDLPDALASVCARLSSADAAWLDAEADAFLAGRDSVVDAATAPFIAAALQVHWTALTGAFVADEVASLDVAGVCVLCGTLPVASIVAAPAPYHGYRYLHCSLCATEWHLVRVQCSHCGANGKDVTYRYLEQEGVSSGETGLTAVRAETCEQCRGYRKIVYQEKDAGVEPLADDVASITLDLLLAESGYHRINANPLLWQAVEV